MKEDIPILAAEASVSRVFAGAFCFAADYLAVSCQGRGERLQSAALSERLLCAETTRVRRNG